MKYKVGDVVIMKEYRGMNTTWFEEDSIQTIAANDGGRYQFVNSIYVAEDKNIKGIITFSEYMKKL